MARNFRIVVADRSALAENLYGLLFADIPADITIKKRFEEARPRFFRRDGIDLAIINSNCLGKKAHEIFSDMASSPEIAEAKKIVLIRESSTLASLDLALKVKNLKLVTCPFHPKEFRAIVLSEIGAKK